MLKNIDPLLTPELLKVLCKMGHGDELVLADANFTAESLGRKRIVQRAVIADAAAADPACDGSRWEAVERFAFCERAAGVDAIVQTGEMQAWANFVFKKGVIADRMRA